MPKSGRKAGYVALRVLIIAGRSVAAVLTLGLSERYMRVSRRIGEHGGMRAGRFGQVYLLAESGYITIKPLMGRRRIAFGRRWPRWSASRSRS